MGVEYWRDYLKLSGNGYLRLSNWRSAPELDNDYAECKFMYAENFIYATPVQKAAEILRAKKSKIVLMTGEETIVGSSSPLAGKWRHFGGGSLMRNGIHPLTGMLLSLIHI